LYEKTHVGTKLLLEDYIDEVTKQLNFICDVDIEDFTIHEKLEFFRNTQKSFGRTALLLSGGGTFGLYHVGIIKSLCEQKLLPKIISGSSAGAIVAAMFGTRTDKEIHLLSEPENINWNFFERENQKGLRFTKISRLLKQGVVFDIEVFNECMKSNIGDITFAEAYNRTGRILNITVSSSTNFEMPRILNYLTAPNVLIRTAVVASSAVPFLFSSAPLLAKDVYRNIVPWNPSGHQWIDGSVEGDLPMQRISELFGVNHYCVSQVNPHIIPFLNNSHQKSNVLTRAVSSIASIVNAEFQHRLRQV
jgi:TAG lipase/steryl ester hydrolase/phospholipase A2/LPA acyltransferase